MKIPITPICCLLLTIPALYSEAPVRASLDRTEQEIVIGQPLVLILELTSPAEAVLDLGPNNVGNLRFSVTEPSGRRDTIKLPIPEFSTIGPIKIEPGKPYLQRINLAPALTVDQAGVYSVGVEITDFKDSSHVIASTDPVNIQVKPKDPDQLRSACDALKLRIENAASATESLQATSELASIQDPVCIADMRALLKRPLGDAPGLIRALEAIGNAEAIEAISSSLASADPVLANVARSALANIESHAHDEGLRELAREALEAPKSPTN